MRPIQTSSSLPSGPINLPDFLLALKNLLTPLFLMGCFPVDFQEVKRPLRAKSVKRPIKVGKRPINEAKRPIKAMVLVGISAGCLMGCFRASRPWWKTAPLKRPIKRSMRHNLFWNRVAVSYLQIFCAALLEETMRPLFGGSRSPSSPPIPFTRAPELGEKEDLCPEVRFLLGQGWGGRCSLSLDRYHGVGNFYLINSKKITDRYRHR